LVWYPLFSSSKTGIQWNDLGLFSP
jgi:hypothetical protein